MPFFEHMAKRRKTDENLLFTLDLHRKFNANDPATTQVDDFENLCVSGGGIKGYAFIGSMQVGHPFLFINNCNNANKTKH